MELGGVLQAHLLGSIAVESFWLSLTFLSLAMLIVGGQRSLTGAVVGACLISAMTEVLRLLEGGVALGAARFLLTVAENELVGVVGPNGAGKSALLLAINHSKLLDRAVWRRFQFHLELPAPTQAQVGRYFEAFANRMGEPLGIGSNAIARSLGEISYAEAEEFCNGVRRRLALSLGEGSLKSIVAEQLELWKARARQPETS